MTASDLIIGVLAIGKVPLDVLKVIAAHITGFLDLNTEILPSLEHPAYAHDPRRQQYDAGIILSTLESTLNHDQDKIIGVLSVDLFVPIFTHVLALTPNGLISLVFSLLRGFLRPLEKERKYGTRTSAPTSGARGPSPSLRFGERFVRAWQIHVREVLWTVPGRSIFGPPSPPRFQKGYATGPIARGLP